MPAFCSEFLRWTLVPLDTVSRTTGIWQNACRPVFNLLLPRIYLISSHILLLYAVPFYSKLKPLDSWIPFSLQLETVQHKLRKSFRNMFGCDLAIYKRLNRFQLKWQTQIFRFLQPIKAIIHRTCLESAGSWHNEFLSLLPFQPLTL